MYSNANNGGSPKLLLLFGTPRSGTTWLGKIFDSHRWTLYKHEPDRSNFGVPFAAPAERAEEWREPVQAFARRLRTINSAHSAARLPVFRKRYRSSLAHPLHRMSVFAAGTTSSFGQKLPVWQFANVESPDVRLVWKSTDSLARLGVILRILESSRAIRIIRHPCGYISSVLRGEALRRFVSSVPTSEDYGIMQKLLESAGPDSHGLTLDHLRKLHPVERLAWIWVLINEKAERETADDPRCTRVRYEDVCRNPIETTQSLFAFCGLDWDPQTTEFIRASTRGPGKSGFAPVSRDARRYYTLFRDPLESAEKWKLEMTEENIARVYRVLRQSEFIELYPESEPALLSPGS